MSSGDKDSGFTSYINSKDNGNVDTEDAVEWSSLGTAVVTSVIATITAGVIDITTAISEAVTRVFGGVEAFLAGGERARLVGWGGVTETDGLIDVTIGRFVEGYADVFVVHAEQFGVLALPVNIVIALAVVYVLGRGGRAIIKQLTGGV